MIITAEIEKIKKDTMNNSMQNHYIGVLKKFDSLVERGIMTRRENQLAVDTKSIRYNL